MQLFDCVTCEDQMTEQRKLVCFNFNVLKVSIKLNFSSSKYFFFVINLVIATVLCKLYCVVSS